MDEIDMEGMGIEITAEDVIKAILEVFQEIGNSLYSLMVKPDEKKDDVQDREQPVEE